MLTQVPKSPTPNSLVYDVVQTCHLGVFSSSPSPLLGSQVPQAEKKERMREVGGEMGMGRRGGGKLARVPGPAPAIWPSDLQPPPLSNGDDTGV